MMRQNANYAGESTAYVLDCSRAINLNVGNESRTGKLGLVLAAFTVSSQRTLFDALRLFELTCKTDA